MKSQDFAVGHFVLGFIYTSQSDLESMNKQWALALEQDPKLSFLKEGGWTLFFPVEPTDYCRAMLLEDIGHLDEAAKCLEAWFETRHEGRGVIGAHEALGRILSSLGNRTRAIEHYRAGIGACNESGKSYREPELHYQLAWCLYETGDRAGAESEFGIALRQRTEHCWEAHYGRGLALWGLRRYEEASWEFRVALLRGCSEPYASEARRLADAVAAVKLRREKGKAPPPGSGRIRIEDRYEEVRRLIDLGRSSGKLPYALVNEILPVEVSSPEEIDDLFLLFDQLGIEVVE